MNKTDEAQVRRWVRRILQEERSPKGSLLNEEFYGFQPSNENFYKAFIAPFANVLKAAKIGAQSILSAASYNLAVLFTFAPSKMEKLRTNYETRKQKLDAEMKEMLTKMKAEAGPDVGLTAFMLNPGGFLGASIAAGTAKEAVDWWKSGGITDALSAYIPGLGPAEPAVGAAAGAAGAGAEQPGIIGGLLSDLNKLFFVAHYQPTGGVLFEAEGVEQQEATPEDFYNKAIADIGLDQHLQEKAQELIDAKEQQVQEVIAAVQPQLEVMVMITNAANADEFNSALQHAESIDLPLGGAQGDSLKGQIEANVTKLLGSDKAREDLIATQREKAGVAPGDEFIPDEKALRKAAEIMVTMAAKENIVKHLSEGAASLRAQAASLLDDPDMTDRSREIMAASPMGKKYLDVIQRGKDMISKL